MCESSGISVIDEVNKGGFPNEPFRLCIGQSLGKSTYIPSMFEKWYDEGNRIPENQTVMVADFEGWVGEFEQLSPEMRVKRLNFFYFLIKFGGGLPHAWIQDKDS
jgi:hypothetical protein